MKVFTNNQFQGWWPVPTAAVVVAEDAGNAAEQLNQALAARGLPLTAKVEDMEPLDLVQGVRILSDGEY